MKYALVGWVLIASVGALLVRVAWLLVVAGRTPSGVNPDRPFPSPPPPESAIPPLYPIPDPPDYHEREAGDE